MTIEEFFAELPIDGSITPIQAARAWQVWTALHSRSELAWVGYGEGITLHLGRGNIEVFDDGEAHAWDPKREEVSPVLFDVDPDDARTLENTITRLLALTLERK